jgi:hypothetical protein
MAPFKFIAKKTPFSLGRTMKVLGIEDEEDMHGVLIKCREGRKINYVPSNQRIKMR